MLMDMFYGATEGVIKHRRRFHFHEVNHVELLYKLTAQKAWQADRKEYIFRLAKSSAKLGDHD
jgi:hypothetical protein